MKKLILQLAFIVLAVNVVFISAGYAATINSASCSQSDVQAAITAASTGDTVIIPSGSCTWTSAVSLAKNITLMGAGATNTIITVNASMQMGLGTWRVTGIGFIVGGSIDRVMSGGKMNNGWRVDHCTFTYSGAPAVKNSMVLVGYHDQPNRRAFGLFDNNTLTNVRVPLLYGGTYVDYTNPEWANSLGLGTADALFIENNTIINTIGSNYNTQPDANCGSRVVFRYNTIDSFNSAMHSVQGNNRAARMWEFYGNVYTSNAFPTWTVAQLRGGTGVAYNNTIGNGFTLTYFLLDNVRSYRNEAPPIGLCDGSNPLDGNRTGGHGYPCRDQIGRSTDDHQMTPTDFPAQSLSPAYFWNNKHGANEVFAAVQGNGTNQGTYHILANRDFYNYNASFNGTTGVGSGLLANRPATCTTNTSEVGGGVAYWATDTNTLYRCSATNTWTVHYKPYTYPHPLTGLAPVTPPPPPPPPPPPTTTVTLPPPPPPTTTVTPPPPQTSKIQEWFIRLKRIWKRIF